MRLGHSLSHETPLVCGLPQGSPASPILIILYIEPILRLGDQKLKFSYGDDVAITSWTYIHTVHRKIGKRSADSIGPEKTKYHFF